MSVQITTALRHSAIGESSGDGLDDHVSIAEDGTQDSSMHSTATTPSPNLTPGGHRAGSSGRAGRGTTTMSSGSSSTGGRGFDYVTGLGEVGPGARIGTPPHTGPGAARDSLRAGLGHRDSLGAAGDSAHRYPVMYVGPPLRLLSRIHPPLLFDACNQQCARE